MKSTMFMSHITVIDHAWITPAGNVRGESFNLSCEVTGVLDGHENVVIDFSACKKVIKHLVDKSNYAIDHRLVLVKGFSDYNASAASSTIETPSLIINGCNTDWYQEISSVGISDNVDIDDQYQQHLSAYLAHMLLVCLRQEYGYPVESVKVHLSTEFTLPAEAKTHVEFRYVHGLRHSSSHGCQNIAHGHRSFIATDGNAEGVKSALIAIASSLQGVLAWDDNKSNAGRIKYESERGKFSMETAQPICWLNTETTVENLASAAAKIGGRVLKDLGCTRLWVSEGLTKGSVVDL